jgi:putative DNA primase/helicase
LALAMAGTISRAGYWPRGEGQAPRGEVLILNFEDDQADTTVPRLMAENADLSAIHFLVGVPDEKGARSFDLGRDTERMSAFLALHPQVRLVIIDPITACMIGTDSHKNSEVRAALHPLAEVAQRHRVCIVAITHLNKGSGMKAMHRVTGSIAFTAAARVVFLVSKDDADPDGERNLFLPIKNNLGDDRTGLSFRTEVIQLTPEVAAPKIIWEDTVTVSADDALTPPNDGKDALKDAKEFLSSLLAAGPVPAGQVFDDAKDAGVGVRALKAAKLKLKVQSRKAGMTGPWEWSLPGATEKMMFGDLLK